ncbi:hypothetical protein NL676_009853 [Syzygium grande]|nr:hypothetical protein NL676_009853 [Syzygium grande]
MERRRTRLRPAAEVATIAAAIVEVLSGGCATPPPSRARSPVTEGFATAVSRGSKDREVGVRCTVISGGDRAAAAAAESSHCKHKS